MLSEGPLNCLVTVFGGGPDTGATVVERDQQGRAAVAAPGTNLVFTLAAPGCRLLFALCPTRACTGARIARRAAHLLLGLVLFKFHEVKNA